MLKYDQIIKSQEFDASTFEKYLKSKAKVKNIYKYSIWFVITEKMSLRPMMKVVINSLISIFYTFMKFVCNKNQCSIN